MTCIKSQIPSLRLVYVITEKMHVNLAAINHIIIGNHSQEKSLWILRY